MLMMLVWRFSLVKGLAADAHDARLAGFFGEGPSS